jgi:hypothetical protein
VLLWGLLRTRYLPILILGGMLALIGGGSLLIAASPAAANSIASLAGIGLLGLGAGATVSPALFVTGFALSSNILGRVLALVELVRSAGDFLLGPVLLQLAHTASGASASGGNALSEAGTRHELGVTLLLMTGATALCVALYLMGSDELPQPDIRGWLQGDEPAICSPPLAARLRAVPQPVRS